MRKHLARRAALGLLAAAFAATLAFGLSACGGGGTEPAPAPDPAPAPEPAPEPAAFVPFDFTDSCGRTVTISEPITRVAISGPVAQQVMLGFAPDLLVGLATKMDTAQIAYLGDWTSLPILGQLYGGKGDLNKEAVAAAKPQILIDWGEAKKTIVEDMDNLSTELGIPCVHIEATMDTYDQAYRLLGKLLGMEDRAEAIAQYCAKAFSSTTAGLAKVAAADKQSGIMVIDSSGNLGVLAKDSYQSQVFDMCVDNIAVLDNPSAKGTGNATDMEQIATWAPAFVLIAPGDLYESAATDPVWATIPAIASGNYLEIPGEPYNWLFGPPSVNQVLGMMWLSRTLYPDVFSDTAKDVVVEYFKLFYSHDLTDAEYAALTANSVFNGGMAKAA